MQEEDEVPADLRDAEVMTLNWRRSHSEHFFLIGGSIWIIANLNRTGCPRIGSTKPAAKAPVEAPARASELVRSQRPPVDEIPNQRLPNDILAEKQGADRDDSSRMEVRAISAFSASRGTLGRGDYLKPTAMTESFGAWFQ
jgi:hypothetical protein